MTDNMLKIAIPNGKADELGLYMKSSLEEDYDSKTLNFRSLENEFIYTMVSYQTNLIEDIRIIYNYEDINLNVFIYSNDVWLIHETFSLINSYYWEKKFNQESSDITAPPEVIWKKENVSITFNNGTITPFNDSTLVDKKDIMYFYYNIKIQQNVDNKINTLLFSTYDYPKVVYLNEFIDNIINFDMKKEGYLLEDYKHNDFHRKVFYHQVELYDLFFLEYFIRIERYDYEVKQPFENEYKMFTQYKMTIGELTNDSIGQAMFFNNLLKEDLLSLKDTANDFIQKTIDYTNTLNTRMKNS